MTVAHYPASLVSSHLNKSGTMLVPQGYYRSKLFIAPFSTNALVAAAGPLLSLLERLCLSPSLPPLKISETTLIMNCLLSRAKWMPPNTRQTLLPLLII